MSDEFILHVEIVKMKQEKWRVRGEDTTSYISLKGVVGFPL
jgi:hypothetical protein